MLESAFKRFVDLVSPIEDVLYVVAIEPRRPDIFTYVKTMDEQVMTKVFHGEHKIYEEFPDILIEFHVVFLEGRPIKDFLPGDTVFFYERDKLKVEGPSGYQG